MKYWEVLNKTLGVREQMPESRSEDSKKNAKGEKKKEKKNSLDCNNVYHVWLNTNIYRL